MVGSREEAQVSGAGKIAAGTFERVIKPRLGAARPEVVVGPRHGVDVGIVDLGNGQVMVATTDPFFVIPELGWERAAWFAVHIVASDAATSGLAPAYMTVDLNLPEEMSDTELEMMWQGVDVACREIGLAVVTGHTGRYEGCDYPMLGGATVICLGGTQEYVTPAMARPGDALIVTKGPAIETTGMLAAVAGPRLEGAIGPDLARAARDLFPQMSVVRDAMAAVEVGVREHGVTAMHDATERGVWGGLVEIAEASGTGLAIDGDAFVVRPEVLAVCELFDLDPFSSSSEGTLLLTCKPDRASAVLDRLAAEGISATQVGEVTPAAEGMRVTRAGQEEPLEAPRFDPFWPAFRRVLEGSW